MAEKNPGVRTSESGGIDIGPAFRSGMKKAGKFVKNSIKSGAEVGKAARGVIESASGVGVVKGIAGLAKDKLAEAKSKSGLADMVRRKREAEKDRAAKEIRKIVAKPNMSPKEGPTGMPKGAVKVSGPSGLQGLKEDQIWRDPRSKDIYRRA